MDELGTTVRQNSDSAHRQRPGAKRLRHRCTRRFRGEPGGGHHARHRPGQQEIADIIGVTMALPSVTNILAGAPPFNAGRETFAVVAGEVRVLAQLGQV